MDCWQHFRCCLLLNVVNIHAFDVLSLSVSVARNRESLVKLGCFIKDSSRKRKVALRVTQFITVALGYIKNDEHATWQWAIQLYPCWSLGLWCKHHVFYRSLRKVEVSQVRTFQTSYGTGSSVFVELKLNIHRNVFVRPKCLKCSAPIMIWMEHYRLFTPKTEN